MGWFGWKSGRDDARPGLSRVGSARLVGGAWPGTYESQVRAGYERNPVARRAVRLTDIPKALYVGTAGNIAMRGVDGTADQLWKNVQAGSILPFRAQYVRAAGTTAGDILALY